MTDIARLGFSVDTKELKAAKKDLDALKQSGKEAGREAASTAQKFDQEAKGAQRVAQGAKQAKGALDQMAQGNRIVQGAQAAASGVTTRFTGVIGALTAKLRGITPASNQASTSLDRLGRAANDNINRLQATPGNVAAQFQDIGVTAAAGMNPMLIALQQGTQLSSAMSGGLKNLAAGLAQVLSPTTLLTVAFVGLVAAVIQMVDWTEVARTGLNALADVFEVATPYILAFVAALALIYSPAILAGIASLTRAFFGLAASILASVGLPVLVVAGLLAIVAAANTWRDDLTQIIGFDLVGMVKDAINTVIGFFVGAFDAIRQTWSRLPAAMGDLAYSAANATLAGIESLINGTINRINGLIDMLPFGLNESLRLGSVSFGRLDNPFEGVAGEVGGEMAGIIQEWMEFDFIGAGVDLANGFGQTISDRLRGFADGLGAGDTEGGRTPRSRAGGRTEPTNAEKFAEITREADKQMRALQQAGAQIGVYGQELMRLRFEQELFNQAQDKGVVLTGAMAAELRRRAAEMAAQGASNERASFIEGVRRDSQEELRTIQQQRQELFLSGQQLRAYRIEQDLLAEARRKNIELGPVEVAVIRESANAQATAIEQLQRMREAINFARDTFRGFWQDWFDGVRQGEGFFKSFGNAVLNTLDRILDKLLDLWIDQAFQQLLGAGGGFGGAGAGGQAGGGIGQVLGSVLANVFGFKNGGTFGTPKRFANGGAFTNSVVDRPTLFRFANGGALGEMGEAGPEAVMPLKRGPNGALGVQMYGGRDKSRAVSVKFENTYKIEGAVSSEDVRRMVKETERQTEMNVKRNIGPWLQELNDNGSFA